MKKRDCLSDYYLTKTRLAVKSAGRLQKLLLTVSLVLPALVVQTEGVLTDTYITKFRAGAAGAYTFTFDDGAIGQWQYAVPILNECDIHATFFLIGSSVEAWYSTVGCIHVPQMLNMAAAGHEIGSHTYNHLSLTELSDEGVHAQMALNQEFFSKYGINVVSMAYPYSATDARVQSIVGQYVEFARDGYPRITNSSSWHELNPLDLKWSSLSDNHYECVDAAITSGTWAIGVFHQVGVEGVLTNEEFSTFVKYVAARGDAGRLWIDTVREIACYIRECSVATLKKSYDAKTNTFKIYLKTGLTNPYIVPLTLRTNIGNYFVKSISQSGMLISYRLLNDQTDRFVQYDAVPDAGDVTIQLTDQPSEQQVVCIKALKEDLNNDCKVDLSDLAILATSWLDCNLEPKEACFN